MNKQKELIKDVIDLLAGFDIDTPQNQAETLQTVINHLGSYPKPQRKGDTVEPHPNILGAYLCMSTIRNTCKLCLLGVYSFDLLTIKVDTELTTALTLILELRK